MRRAVVAICCAILFGCSQPQETAAEDATEAFEATEQAPGAPAASDAAPSAARAAGEAADASRQTESSPSTASIPVSQPKIAYVYQYGFRVSTDRIPELQRAHADLCERQGPRICRIIEMRQSGAEGDYASGSLVLAVAAPRARAFGAELAGLAKSAGGEEVSAAITGEDLSKQIVDTEARLRARALLRDRLMEVLATRKGSVAELVEAERSVAQVNEEIDQARAWLAEMQGRVDFSRVEIAYTSGAPAGGFSNPIRGAVGSIGSILGMLVAAGIIALTIGVPLAVVGFGGWWLVRRVRILSRPAPTPPEIAAE